MQISIFDKIWALLGKIISVKWGKPFLAGFALCALLALAVYFGYLRNLENLELHKQLDKYIQLYIEKYAFAHAGTLCLDNSEQVELSEQGDATLDYIYTIATRLRADDVITSFVEPRRGNRLTHSSCQHSMN
jgi:hypothetical protein